MSPWSANLIKIARRQARLTQRELAKKAGTSQSAIASYEAGRQSPSIETLARIVRAANLDLRIRLEPLDDHDDWLRRYEASLPPEVVAAVRHRDMELRRQATAQRN